MIALGAVVETKGSELSDSEFHSRILDYYDHWSSVDPRLAEHHGHLSPQAAAFGHDLVNMATYSNEILAWLEPRRIRDARSVVCVGGMTEAFIVSIRSASDAVAGVLSYKASAKLGQAPSASLGSLVNWAKKNKLRVHPDVSELVLSDLSWFWKVRSLRDSIVHDGASAVIHCDGRQFNLWVHNQKGWITREPLLPFLANQLRELTAFADLAADTINNIIGFPDDRVGSRVVQGVMVPALHKLLTDAALYADASP